MGGRGRRRVAERKKKTGPSTSPKIEGFFGRKEGGNGGVGGDRSLRWMGGQFAKTIAAKMLSDGPWRGIDGGGGSQFRDRAEDRVGHRSDFIPLGDDAYLCT